MCVACNPGMVSYLQSMASRRDFLKYMGIAAGTAFVCSDPGAALAQQALASDPADIVFRGGPILTMDGNSARAEALAIRGNRIVAVGKADDVQAFSGAKTRVIDLDGRTLMPGLIDPHMHFVFTAFEDWIDVSPITTPDFSTIWAKLQKGVADAKPANGGKHDQPAGVPDKVAVLPQQPKLKEGKSAAQVDASAASNQPKDGKPAQQMASAAAKAGGSYTVQQGDTLSSIARKTGVGVVALKQANGMQDGILKIGQTLKVPAGGTVAVASAKPAAPAKTAAVDPVTTATTQPAAKATPSETLASYTPPKKDAKVIQQAEDDEAVAPNSTGIGKMRWPVRGRVISGFGSGKDGVDIAVPEGTPVKAAENGVVIYAGDGLKEFGNTVLVRHENGLVTVYGHAKSIEVQRGQKVKRGQEIALSGMSGTTDSPKLHVEVRKNSAPVDPSTYLE